MGRRDLLTDDERRLVFGFPTERDALARLYTFGPADVALIEARRRSGNRLGFALQLALIRHPGFATVRIDEAPDELVAYVAEQLRLPTSALRDYARRPQTSTDHVREIAVALGLRGPSGADFSLMIEAAARAAWATDKGLPIALGVIETLRAGRILLPAPTVIERVGVAGRARARRRTADALLADLSPDQIAQLDALLTVDPAMNATPLAWLKNTPSAPSAAHVRALVDKLTFVRRLGIAPECAARVHPDRFRQFVREGRTSLAYLLERYAAHRRRAILVAVVTDLEEQLTDAVIEMVDRLVGNAFARAKNTKERRYTATARDVGRLMRLFHGTIEALCEAAETGNDALAVVKERVGWQKLLHARDDVAELAELADEDHLIKAADRYATLKKFAPVFLEALDFKAARRDDQTLAAVKLLRDLNKAGKRDMPDDAPMPFKKEWRSLIQNDGRPDRRLYETAVLAHLRNKLRSGDIWVERSSSYRRFDSYLLASSEAATIAGELGLPASAESWLESRRRQLDWRLKRFAQLLCRGKLDGVALHDGKLSVTPVRANAPPEAEELAERIDHMMPRARITEILHEVARDTGFLSAFTNLRTGEPCSNENALLAAILADATNLGLARMANASQGITRDQLVWTADAFIREDTYKAALARLIDAHHQLPIAAIWGAGDTSSSDGQFFRSGKRGNIAGDVNARYGVDPGFTFYTHVSDQHGPYHATVISATAHEAPYVLDGLLHHGSSLQIVEHYTDTRGATDHVFALCPLLGFRFCPRLRDFPDRRFASFETPAAYAGLETLMGKRIKADIVAERWDEILRLVASLKAGVVAPSAMLKKLAAYERQNQLDLALQEVGRIERTLFMLDWLESPDLRRRCHAGLNKGEQRHALTQAICTFRQGRIAERSHEAQQYRASGLNLVVAAIVYWNSTYIADAVGHLRALGEPVPSELLAHTSPVGWEHIAFSGDFLWDRAAALPSGRRPLHLSQLRQAA
jgi:TnpA family transposase